MEVNGRNMTYEEVMELFECTAPTEPGQEVILSNDEINRAQRNKRVAKKKAALFNNTPIYRTLHASMR